jgi:hypothetical protein
MNLDADYMQDLCPNRTCCEEDLALVAAGVFASPPVEEPVAA